MGIGRMPSQQRPEVVQVSTIPQDSGVTPDSSIAEMDEVAVAHAADVEPVLASADYEDPVDDDEDPVDDAMAFVPIEYVPVEDITPSPENDSLYGAIDQTDLDLVNLCNDIVKHGIREPIQASADGFIVSGHRRYAAARLGGLTTVPVRYLALLRSNLSELEWKQKLRAFNHQRVKSPVVRMREAMLDIDPALAHRQLLERREERDREAPPRSDIVGVKTRCAISERKKEMLAAAIKVINDLKRFWPLSVRQVHYGLLNAPPLRNSSTGKQRAAYENNRESYQDLTDLMARARLLGMVPWEAVTDETRPVSGTRYHRDASAFVDIECYNLLVGYRRDLLQSQLDHVELVLEKLTVQRIIQPIANQYCLPMTVGRGYCSLEPRYEIAQRYRQSGKDRLILLIVADFDPDGDEIAESLARSLRDDFGIESVEYSKILLRQDQVRDLGLPPNAVEAKTTSSRYQKFFERYGSNAVYELEAIPPSQMQSIVREAIEATIDLDKFNDELEQEKWDAAELELLKREAVKTFQAWTKV